MSKTPSTDAPSLPPEIVANDRLQAARQAIAEAGETVRSEASRLQSAISARRVEIAALSLAKGARHAVDLTARRLLDRLNSWSWMLPDAAADQVAPAAQPTTAADVRQDEIVTAQAQPDDERR